MFETILKLISDAYGVFERLNLSASGVIAIAIVLSIALLFALREAISWFFKIDDLKRDMRELREVNLQFEGEVRALQATLGKLITRLSENAASTQPKSIQEPSPESAPATPPNFPIVH